MNVRESKNKSKQRRRAHESEQGETEKGRASTEQSRCYFCTWKAALVSHRWHRMEECERETRVNGQAVISDVSCDTNEKKRKAYEEHG